MRFDADQAGHFEHLFKAEVYPLREAFKAQEKLITAFLSPVVDGDEIIEGVREYILHVELPGPEEHDAFNTHPQFLRFLEKVRPTQLEEPKVRIGETLFQI